MKRSKFILKTASKSVGVLVAAILLVQMTWVAGAAAPEPGSDQDPIVTKSYVDSTLGGMNTKITQLTEGLKNITKSINDLSTAQKNLKNLTSNVEKEYNSVFESIYSAEKQNKNLSTSINSLKTQMDNVNKKLSDLYTKMGQTPPPGTSNTPVPTKKPQTTPTPSKNSTAASGDFKFVTVKLAPGKSLIGSAGTEIILRIGSAKAVAGSTYGIIDLATAKDLVSGQNIVINHLILVPIDDNRGIKATTNCTLIVRGKYTIK